jgi:hypothetical protein
MIIIILTRTQGEPEYLSGRVPALDQRPPPLGLSQLHAQPSVGVNWDLHCGPVFRIVPIQSQNRSIRVAILLRPEEKG